MSTKQTKEPPYPSGDGGSSFSINEPSGSNIYRDPPPPPPVVLSDIDPDSVVVGSTPDPFTLTVTGTGFDATCIVVVDDEEQGTTFVSDTQLIASIPVATVPGIVDVEVHRGEDMSDVLTFEFTAVRRARKEPERKAKKEPVHKRPGRR